MIDKAGVTDKHNSVAQGVQQLHGLNCGHNNLEPRGCLLNYKDKCLKLADLASSTQLKMCMYFTPYQMRYLACFWTRPGHPRVTSDLRSHRMHISSTCQHC